MNQPRTWLALWVALSIHVVPAAAEERVGVRSFGIQWENGAPRISISLADLISSAEARKKLKSGLPQTILFHLSVARPGSDRPIVSTWKTCRIVYDLWDDRFRVQAATPSETTVSFAPTVDQVAAQCLVAGETRLSSTTEFDQVRGQPVVVYGFAQLNPLSPETVQRIRRWLSRSHDGGRANAESFFGSFASIFVSRNVGEADATVRVRSQTILVPR